MNRPLFSILALLLLSCDRKVEPWDALTLKEIRAERKKPR